MNTRILACILNDDQLRQRGAELAELHHKLSLNEAEKKAANADFKAKQEELINRSNDVAKEISSRTEYRPVLVIEEKNFETKEAYTIRTDTGEVVQTRALHPEELARPLPFDKDRPQAADMEAENAA